jgi:hypothetical protein
VIATSRPSSFALQLDVVIAGHTQSRTGLRHRHDRLQRVDDTRAAIHQVTQEDRLASIRMTPRSAAVANVPELLEQILELVATAVNVTDDVERPSLVLPVIPQRLTLDDSGIDVFLRLQHVHVTEALTAKTAKRAMELAPLIPHDVRPEVPIRPRRGCVRDRRVLEVQDDCYRQDVVLARQGHEGLARFGLDVRRIDTASFPRARRRAATKCSAANASSVATCSFSSSDTSALKPSDDSTSVG